MKKYGLVSLLVALVTTLAASSAYADDCGEKDRVPLPVCAKTGKIQGTKPGIWVHNLCSHPITVKFDKPGGDARVDVSAGKRHDQETPPDTTKVTCCPRYNSCVHQTTAVQTPPAGLQNLALKKTATQSSTLNGGDAARAVDGNTDGNWSAGSVTHTDSSKQAWWQVDLGAVYKLKQVFVYNRTDCCGERLSDFTIVVSKNGVNGWTRAALATGLPQGQNVYTVNAAGRFVRVQLRGTNNLSLAEVEVYGQ